MPGGTCSIYVRQPCKPTIRELFYNTYDSRQKGQCTYLEKKLTVTVRASLVELILHEDNALTCR